MNKSRKPGSPELLTALQSIAESSAAPTRLPAPTHSYAVEQRLRMIDFLLKHYGSLRRAALMDYFGISMPQASADIKEYMKLAPQNMQYDPYQKMYTRKSTTFQPIYP
jgi:hypothetical protein